jgi:hypothetical protein
LFEGGDLGILSVSEKKTEKESNDAQVAVQGERYPAHLQQMVGR